MLYEESVWIGNTLLELNSKYAISPLLNIGSSTRYFREVKQAYVHENIFAPLQKEMVIVRHLDIKEADGVDIVGDLSDIHFLENLRRSNYRSVLCSNLLEHVEHPEKICSAICDVVERGGYIMVTVPNLYPYHNDPIDTKFRPDIEQLHSMFPETELVKGDVLTINLTHLQTLLQRKRLLFITLIRIFLPFYKFSNWRKIVSDFPNLRKKYRVSCIVLRKL